MIERHNGALLDGARQRLDRRRRATTPSVTMSMVATTQPCDVRSVVGLDEVFARLSNVDVAAGDPPCEPLELTWVGSVGYERHKDHREFAEHLRRSGVERLIDVRELPISRRRGYAKTALSEAMGEAGIEYMHLKALGNPKPLRDLYKSGRVAEGRAGYERFLLGERREALNALVPLLEDKRSALMCLEHDASTCHRTVILDALRSELGLSLDVAEVS